MDDPVWEVSWRYDPVVAHLADRHYSRVRPGTPGFCGSGRPLVLRTRDRRAAWVTFWQPNPTHRWKQAWTNVFFRNEGPHRASRLIREAVAVTVRLWGPPPPDGFVTFVDPRKVRRKQHPGHCYVIAGWRPVGCTESGLLAFQLRPDKFPSAMAPYESQVGFSWARFLGERVNEGDRG